MLQITKNDDEILLREKPFAQRLFALAIAPVIFFLVYVAVISVTDDAYFALGSGVLAAFAVSSLYLLNSPSVTVKIHKQGKTVSIRRQNLFRYSFKVFSFDEIADLIFVRECQSSTELKTYQIMMPLKSGEEVALSGEMRMNIAEYFDAADSMNIYIFNTSKRLPAKVATRKLFNL